MRILVAIACCASCVTLAPSPPWRDETMVVGGRPDGAMLLGHRVTSGHTSFSLAGAPDATPHILDMELSELPPRGVLAATPAVAEALEKLGMTTAERLSPVPSTGGRQFTLHDVGLTLKVEEATARDGWGKLAVVRAADAWGASAEVATVAVLRAFGVVDAVRAGDRVGLELESALDGRITRSLVLIDVRRASAKVMEARGLQRYWGRQLPEATLDLTKAIDLDPTYADARYNLACVHALAGETKLSVLQLEAAFRLDPVRVRNLAAEDRDLTFVVQLPDVRRVLGLADPLPRAPEDP